MTGAEHVELAIRSAKSAAAMLDMMDCRIETARMRFALVIRQLKEIDELIGRIEKANAPAHGREDRSVP